MSASKKMQNGYFQLLKHVFQFFFQHDESLKKAEVILKALKAEVDSA